MKSKLISRQYHPFILTIGRIFLERRWLVFAIGTPFVFLIEVVGHWADTSPAPPHFFYGVFTYGIIGPFIIWVLLTMLANALAINVPIRQIQAEATQAERQRIARDLHDKLAQNLGYLHFKLDVLASSKDAILTDIESIQTDLENMRQIANQAYSQVRNTLDTLRPPQKPHADLVDALREQAKTIAGRSGLEITVNCISPNISLCPLVKRTILDITQEALTNVDKHADADQVTINVTCKDNNAFLTILDNGKGFDPANPTTVTGHYGLDIMKERTEEVGGYLNIKSTLNQGTQLTAQFPNTIINTSMLQKCRQLNCETHCLP